MRSRSAAALIAGSLALAAAGPAAGAEIVISIDKAAQSMVVLVDGAERHRYVVSTGTGGGPHNGTYRAGRMERKWFSRKYGMAPMPYSIFFDGNYAIHGTTKVSQLGRRASKGCVRLHPRDAAALFALVAANKSETSIVVASAGHVAAAVPAPAPSEAAKSEPAKPEAETAAAPASGSPKPVPVKTAAAPQLEGEAAAARNSAAPAVRVRPRKAHPARAATEAPPSLGSDYGRPD